MMTRRFALWALPLLGFLLFAAPFAVAAEDVLQLVPDSAWAVVRVSSLSNVDAKSKAIGEEMELPIPGLLAGFRQVTGIQAGLDENSPAALIVLPAEGDEFVTRVVLLPVTDYDGFRDALNPKSKTDEITEVTLSGRAALIRHVGGYAAVTHSENHKSLESIKVSGEVPASLKSWQSWMAERDVAGVLLQPGVKGLSAKGQAWLNMMKGVLGQMGDQGKQAVAAFGMYEKALQASEKEVVGIGIGVQLDDQKVLRVTSRTELAADGNWAKAIGKAPAPKESLVQGLPSDPYVAAGGAALSEASLQNMMKLSVNVMKSMPEMYGLSQEQIDKMSDQLTPKIRGLQSMSMVLGVGKDKDPIYANMLGVMRVENAQAFLDGYEEYFKQYNEIIKGAKSAMIPPMEVEKTEVAGVEGLQVTMKIPKPNAGPMPPAYDQMIEAMLGPGGKMVFWMAPADEHTVVTGYVTKAPMERLMAAIKEKQPGLAANAELAKTVALLPADAPMAAYLSPQGTVELVKRMIAAFVPPGMQERMNVPDFPQTSPLGLAVKSGTNEVLTTLVVPADVLAAIGKYVRHIRDMSREDVTMNR
jgi:hypothetical protein